jgi:hypothetical protein
MYARYSISTALCACACAYERERARLCERDCASAHESYAAECKWVVCLAAFELLSQVLKAPPSNLSKCLRQLDITVNFENIACYDMIPARTFERAIMDVRLKEVKAHSHLHATRAHAHAKTDIEI